MHFIDRNILRFLEKLQMKLLFVTTLLAALVAWNAAHSEARRADTVLAAGSSSGCPDVVLVYGLSLNGAQISGRSPRDVSFQATAGPDGSVTATHPGAPGVGTVTIVGNAQSKALELTATGLTGCRYTLVPQSLSQATGPTGAVHDWAIGRWNGTVYIAYAGQGMKAEGRSLIVNHASRGGVACRWAEPEYVEVTFARDCKVGVNTIELTTVANSSVEVTRRGPNEIDGWFKVAGAPRFHGKLTRQ